MTVTREPWLGKALPRVEDRRLISGNGQYVSDIHFAGEWVMALVRSPHAHARILSIKTAEAAKLPGVHAMLTAQNLEDLKRPMPGMSPVSPSPLAASVVRYVGEPVVAILADNRYVAEDAAELVQITYEGLPALTDAEKALESPVILHPDLGTNLVDHIHYQSGLGQEALKSADVVIAATLRMGRVSAQPMEPRALVAHYEPDTGGLTVYHATQSVHRAQERIAEFLGLDRSLIRVIAPEVGGGFGVKNAAYPEEILTTYCARHFQRTVKWIGDRFEEFLGTYQERQQVHHVQLGITREGAIVGLVDTYFQDNGAYPAGGMIVSRTTARNLPGPYRVPHLEIDGYAVMTNKVPQTPYRGAGRPQGHYIIERMLDRAADQLGLDRIDIRRRNLIAAEQLPYATGIPDAVYDSGDFPKAFDELIHTIDYAAFRKRQKEALSQGIRLGLGVANYVEVSAGFGFEGARVALQPDGHMLITTGATGQGQGHRTALAQVAADALSVPIEHITVIEGDTHRIAKGIGTFGSRTMIMAGNATRMASDSLVRKAKERATHLLEADVEDIALDEGRFFVKGVPSLALDWPAIARSIEESDAQRLATEEYFSSGTPTYGFGTHAVIVRADEITCQITIERYAILHDGGTIVNPLLANGQVIGGTIQGLGSALYEEMIYGDDGQPLTTSFLDYHLPSAVHSPDIEIYHHHYPAPGNPAGHKGVGEAGIIPSQAVILSAVEDAFRDRGLTLDYAPVTPVRLYTALLQGKGESQ